MKILQLEYATELNLLFAQFTYMERKEFFNITQLVIS